ncbi:MAG: 4-carboxy-4-hydroxy-2-oxoadipate aldolase/oxaloacetate decarboxylase [Clostridiaceae bacterium]|nr:4-carboxy-4-hydroxy-2-oxoadipate aldolase/oxaloacetate decarboxylase [Clostridiaceae bacterium]
MKDVIRNHPRPSAELLERFSDQQPATLHESMGKRGALANDIRPAWFGTCVCGSALTVHCRPGDNIMLHKAVSLAQPGDVLVVSADGFTEAGMWGEIITVAAIEKGIRGIVTDGGVRDTMPIYKLGFPMYARGFSMKGTTKATGGTINQPIVIGGVQVKPGDIVVGDNDGVVVMPLEEAETILAAAIAREQNEASVMDRIRAGESTMDILGFQATYDRLGLSED